MSVSGHAAELKGVSVIEAVTVFPQGAEIVRVAKAAIPAGSHEILIGDLPGQTIASSIRVNGTATGAVEIGSVDTARVFVGSDDAEVQRSKRKQLEDAIEKKRDELVAIQDVAAAANAQKSYLDNLAHLPTASSNAPRGSGEDWAALFGLIGSRMAEAGKAATDARIRERAVNREIADLQKELAALAPKPVQRSQTRIHVTARAATEATFRIRYQVPLAGWSAFYDARLSTGEAKTTPSIQLTRRAAVTNRSGEDWRDVTLALSTTRPGSSTTAPDLTELVVDYLSEPRPIAKSAPVAAGQAQPQLRRREAGSRLAEDNAQPVGVNIVERMTDASVSAFQAVFSVPGMTTVPGNGQAKRVQIMAESAPVQLVIRTVPRLDPVAYLYAKMALPKSTTPLLPGTISLFRDGVFVGTGTMPMLVPGEDHQLGFGADDRVAVKRTVLEDKKGQTGTFTSSRTEEQRFAISVKSQHPKAIQVEVIDRIPVSAQQDIKVDTAFTGLQPVRRDLEGRRGAFLWQFALDPGEEKKLGFEYRVIWPADKQIQYRETTTRQAFGGGGR